MNEVVITGYSVVSPLGNSIAEFGERMFRGDSGVRDIRGDVVAKEFPVPYAAILPDTLGLPPLADNRYCQEAEIIAASLLRETLSTLPEGQRIDGVIYGTAENRSFQIGVETLREKEISPENLNHLYPEFTLNEIQEYLQKHGYGEVPRQNAICVCNTCITGPTVIGQAFGRIRQGRWQRALVATYEPRVRDWNLMGLHLLGALTTANVPPATASRPFAKGRSGFVKGEGAGMLLLESRQAAERRDAKIFGEVLGFAQTSDQWRLTDGRGDSMGAIRAIQGALADARIDKSRIGYINAHGTSTPMNDRLETQAIKAVFAQAAYGIPVSSLKSQIGHLTISCGMVEAIATLIMLAKQTAAPTINYGEADPDCDLDYVPNHARELDFTYALSNSFGFGGANACLVLKRHAPESRTTP